MMRKSVTYRKSARERVPQTHLIGNAHLDPVWLWRYPEGLAEIKATVKSALDRMDEFPDYIFTFSSAFFYQWIEENSPELFTQIVKRVAEGRWIPVGGMWIQPDCNLPSGESFVRQMLYGQSYFKEKFGRICVTGYNVDSFGHNGMMPKLLQQGGMSSYVFQRPMEYENSELKNLFVWESSEGSQVLAYKIPLGYGDWLGNIGGLDDEGITAFMNDKITAITAIGKEQKIPMMMFYGVGNHGGGPSIRGLKDLTRYLETHKDTAFSDPDSFFCQVESLRDKLPIVSTDLQHHASGCYSVHSRIKQLNCRAENLLARAETYMSLAAGLTAMPYDRELLEQGWKEVLFNQFHDIIAGTSIKDACADAESSYHEALSISRRVQNRALQKISWAVDTMGEENIVLSKEKDWIVWETENKGIPVVVFNNHSFPVSTCVKINRDIMGSTDYQGRPQVIQKVRAPYINQEDKYNTLIPVEIPPMGYALYWIFKTKSFDLPEQETVSAGCWFLENRRVRYEFNNETGAISRILRKSDQCEMLDEKGMRVLVIDDVKSDTWAHDRFSFHEESGCFSDARLQIREIGPLRSTIRVVTSFEDSILRQDYTLYQDSEELEVSVRMDLRMQNNMLKVQFNTTLADTEAVYQIPYGIISKAANGIEEAGQRWVSLRGKDPDGNFQGFALINTGKYSFSMEENRIEMVIARTSAFAEHYGKRDEFCEYIDQGVQEFSYLIKPFDGGDDLTNSKTAFRFNQPVEHIVETYHYGTLPQTYSGISISHDQVVVCVYKRSEDGLSTVIRCIECSGHQVNGVTISFPDENRSITSDFLNHEIKTFVISDDPEKPIIMTNILEGI